MNWDNKVWFSPVFTFGPSRYLIIIIALFINNNLFNQVKPSVSEFLTIFWVRWIFLFLAILVIISDINKNLTYRNCFIALVSSLLFTVFAYYFLYDSYKMVFTQAQVDDIKLYLQHPEIQELIKNIKDIPIAMFSAKYDRIVQIETNKEYASKIPAVIEHNEVEAPQFIFPSVLVIVPVVGLVIDNVKV